MSKKGWLIALVIFIVFSIIIIFLIREGCNRFANRNTTYDRWSVCGLVFPAITDTGCKGSLETGAICGL